MKAVVTFILATIILQVVLRDTTTAQNTKHIEFVDVTERAGIKWGQKTLTTGTYYLIETMGGGGGFVDYNNDGLLDIYFVSYSSALQTNQGKPGDVLYRNNGDGTFTDVTERAGINNNIVGMGLAVGDYNNDGWSDLYVSGFGANKFYRNNGNGTFTDVTVQTGVNNKLWGTSAAWFDYDGDGFLDLFVCNYLQLNMSEKIPCQFFENVPYCNIKQFKGSASLLYRNNRDGTFTDVSRKAGIADLSDGKGLGVIAFDYDNDGRIDIFQANDAAPNFLFRNNGNGTFKEVAFEANCAFDPNGEVRGGMGVDAEDLDGNGFLDIFVTNFSQQTNAFWHNNGDGTFDETTYALGLGTVSIPMSGFGTRFFDYNNDGRTDLFVLNGHPFGPINKVFPETTYAEPPFLFENTGKGFIDVAASRGAALKKFYLGRGLSTGDFDNDGDTDLLLMNAGEPPVLLRNDGGNKRNWLGVKLVGTKSNRDAINAKVTISINGVRQTKHLLGGTSYCSASDLRLLFGLGETKKVDEIIVMWQGGNVTKLKDLAVNRYITIKEESK